MEIVQQISEFEAVFKSKDPMGKVILSHQWMKESPLGAKWSPCCHTVPERFGIQAIQQQCDRFGRVAEILGTDGQQGMLKRILGK